MPKVPLDYSKTIIYKIVCNDLNIKYCYVGHTTNFIKRKSKHKQNCHNEKSNKDYHFKVYQTIRANGGWDNWSMVEIEKFPCECLNEATKRERYFYEELNADLNTNVPNRPVGEYIRKYYIENKETINEKQKQIYIKNKEEIQEQHKEYYKNSLIELLVKQKEYRENNKEKVKVKDMKYYEKNKDAINERARERYNNKKKISV